MTSRVSPSQCLPCEGGSASKSPPEAQGINSHLTTKIRQLHHLMHITLEDVGILTSKGVSHQRLLEFNLRPVMVGASGSSSLWISNPDQKFQTCKIISTHTCQYLSESYLLYFKKIYIFACVRVLTVRLLWPHTLLAPVHFRKVAKQENN